MFIFSLSLQRNSFETALQGLGEGGEEEASIEQILVPVRHSVNTWSDPEFGMCRVCIVSQKVLRTNALSLLLSCL